jgi:hypothetical protein
MRSKHSTSGNGKEREGKGRKGKGKDVHLCAILVVVLQSP